MEELHQFVLQSFMSRGILNQKEVKELHKVACETYGATGADDPVHLANVVIHINKHIRPLNMEIKKALSEENGSSHYVLVNLLDSPITKLAVDYTPQQYDFVKTLVDAVVESDDGCVSSIELLNSASATKKMRKDQAEALLDKLQLEKWIIYQEGMVSLATRALAELEQYIRETFADFPVICEMCKKVCIKGQACASCDVKLHVHCAGKLFGEQTNLRCPGSNCGAPWPHQIQRKKKADAASARQVSGAATPRGPKQRRT